MDFEDLFSDLSGVDSLEEFGDFLAGSGAAIVGFLGLLYFALFFWIILHLVAWCKLFSKAGLPWERMFVPLYGSYWQYKIADSPGIFWIQWFLFPAIAVGSMLVSGVGLFAATAKTVSTSYSTSSYSGSRRVTPSPSSSSVEDTLIGGLSIGVIIITILSIALVVMWCIYLVRLAKCYGQSGGFAVGLILLYPIFILILGFGSSQYVGSQGNFNRMREESMKRSWTCSICNTSNPASRATCETCGASRT